MRDRGRRRQRGEFDSVGSYRRDRAVGARDGSVALASNPVFPGPSDFRVGRVRRGVSRALPTPPTRTDDRPDGSNVSRVLGSDRTLVAVLTAAWFIAAVYVVTREVRDRTADADEAGADGRATEGTGEFVGEERSEEEIEALGEADAEAEPAEPGELTVDDEVVDEVLEEDEETDARTDSEETADEG